MTQRRNGQRALHTQQKQQQRARDERLAPADQGDVRGKADDYRDGYRAGHDAHFASESTPQEETQPESKSGEKDVEKLVKKTPSVSRRS